MKKLICLIITLLTMPCVVQGKTPNSAVQQTKIVTNCPYLKVSIVKCEANGKTVILELKMTNMSDNDANKVGLWGTGAIVYDDQGNKYYRDNISMKFANMQFTQSWIDYDFLADIPVKVAIKIDGVSTLAESLARVTIEILNDGGLGIKKETPITLRNIPITRQ